MEIKTIKEHVDKILEISSDILSAHPKYVTLDHSRINICAENIAKKTDKPNYDFFKNNLKHGQYIEVLKELTIDSVNYCFFYGHNFVKWVDSTTLHEDIESCFDKGFQSVQFRDVIQNKVIPKLVQNRYPLLEERIKHLNEVAELGEEFASRIGKWHKYSPDQLFQMLITWFPGYGSDIFLKRAFLFFIMLNRKLNLFEDIINQILVPADYQLPKVLRHLGCIEYEKELSEKIEFNELIPKWSLMENQIRAATIIACYQLQKKSGWNANEIDTILWMGRKTTNDYFHMSITSDY